jgi:hypothetical protein
LLGCFAFFADRVPRTIVPNPFLRGPRRQKSSHCTRQAKPW